MCIICIDITYIQLVTNTIFFPTTYVLQLPLQKIVKQVVTPKTCFFKASKKKIFGWLIDCKIEGSKPHKQTP